MCEILQRFEDRFFFELSHSLPKFFEWHWKLLAKKNNKENFELGRVPRFRGDPEAFGVPVTYSYGGDRRQFTQRSFAGLHFSGSQMFAGYCATDESGWSTRT